MISYKDRTFCMSDCVNKDCDRFYSKEVVEGARAWWSHDPDNAPIAVTDFSKRCGEYEIHNPKKTKKR